MNILISLIYPFNTKLFGFFKTSFLGFEKTENLGKNRAENAKTRKPNETLGFSRKNT